MRKIGYVGALVVLMSGCAQSQLARNQGSQTTKSFEACGLSVQFSGQPSEMRESLPAEMLESLGGKPVEPAWRYTSYLQGVHKYELGLCVCPMEPILSRQKTDIMQTSTDYKFVDGIGYTYEGVITELDNKLWSLDKVILGNASSCFLHLSAGAIGTPEVATAAALPFMSSVAAIQKEQKPVGKTISATASERLKQLDSLLKEKLITGDEFSKRRTVILESL